MKYVEQLDITPILDQLHNVETLSLSGYGRNTINGVAYTSNSGSSTDGFNYSFGMIKSHENMTYFDMDFVRKHNILPPYVHNKPTEYYHNVAPTFKLLEDAGIELFRARLSLLRGGQVIPDHADSPTSSDYCIKVHIPIITNDSARFVFGDQSYKMDVGKIYLADVSERHSFINPEPSDRYHIIADCIVKNKDLPFYCHDYNRVMDFYNEWNTRLNAPTSNNRWLSQSNFYRKGSPITIPGV